MASRSTSAVFLGLLAASGAACGPAPLPPPGSYSEVALIVTGGATGEVGASLRRALEREQDFFVAVEPLFRTTVLGEADAAAAPPVKNVIVCAVPDPATALGRRVIDTIGEDDAARVRRGDVHVLARENHPSAGQVTLVVTAANDGDLRRVVGERADEIVAALERSCRERLRAAFRREGTAAVRGNGYRAEVPRVYRRYALAGDSAGVEFRREGPPRVLAVFARAWRGVPSPENADSLFAWRAAVAARCYDGDRMDRARARFEPARFAGTGAVRMCGYWFNDRRRPAGGYFETYFVADEALGRLWAVDLVVYAPGREKAPLVRELRAIAETFRFPGGTIGTVGAHSEERPTDVTD